MNSFHGAMAVCPICDRTYFQDQPWKRVCIRCYLAHKNPATQPVMLVAPRIESNMLQRLIYLVHPDKHHNSEAANIATRYLLEMRGAS